MVLTDFCDEDDTNDIADVDMSWYSLPSIHTSSSLLMLSILTPEIRLLFNKRK